MPGEHADAGVGDLRRLAVHHALGAHDVAAVARADALVTETHAEHRDPRLAERGDRVHRDAGVLGPAGTGRDEHRVGREGAQLVEREGVVAVHLGLGTELTEVLDEVVDERVVVVDHEDPGAHRRRRYRNRRRRLGPITSADRAAVEDEAPDRRPPPKPKTAPPSKLWVPALMFSLLFIGVLVIVTNYFGMLVGGENNAFLLIGIAYVTGGFIVATMLR